MNGICFALAVGGVLVGVTLYLLGGVRPPAPSVERWMGGQEPAWQSPPLLAAIRGGTAGRALAGTLAAALPGHGGGHPLAGSITSHLTRHTVRGHGDRSGPVLFAYDGSDLARAAIAEAGHQMPARRDALVLTVWRTFNVGFVPEPGLDFDAASGNEVREAAQQTAAHGASLAAAAGFRAHGMAVEGTPTWKAIADAADDRDASLIVLGTHGRAGLSGLVAGSVAEEVASHSRRPVLIVPAAAEPTLQHRAAGQKPAARKSPGNSGNGRPGRGDSRARLGGSTTVRSG